MTPPIGWIVFYRLSEHDAEAINRRRVDAHAYALRVDKVISEHPAVADQPGGIARTGFVAHTGNAAAPGAVYPAIVVAAWSPTTVNLQVLLDGNDTYWATSRQEADELNTLGRWTWPKREGE